MHCQRKWLSQTAYMVSQRYLRNSWEKRSQEVRVLADNGGETCVRQEWQHTQDGLNGRLLLFIYHVFLHACRQKLLICKSIVQAEEILLTTQMNSSCVGGWIRVLAADGRRSDWATWVVLFKYGRLHAMTLNDVGMQLNRDHINRMRPPKRKCMTAMIGTVCPSKGALRWEDQAVIKVWFTALGKQQ